MHFVLYVHHTCQCLLVIKMCQNDCVGNNNSLPVVKPLSNSCKLVSPPSVITMVNTLFSYCRLLYHVHFTTISCIHLGIVIMTDIIITRLLVSYIMNNNHGDLTKHKSYQCNFC